MAPHSVTLAWKIPWMEEPGGLQSMGSLRVKHNWATSLSLFTFLRRRRKWQPTPVFLPGESHGKRSLVGYSLWGSQNVGLQKNWTDLMTKQQQRWSLEQTLYQSDGGGPMGLNLGSPVEQLCDLGSLLPCSMVQPPPQLLGKGKCLEWCLARESIQYVKATIIEKKHHGNHSYRSQFYSAPEAWLLGSCKLFKYHNK